ncbi:nitroreductase family protein [Chloroflexota bacterium]
MIKEDFLQLVKTRRSIRGFKPDPVPDEYINYMIDVARWSPSGANGQPWEFIVIKDQDTKNKMAELYELYRGEHYAIEQTRVEELRHHRTKSAAKGLPAFKDAPVLITACGDRRTFQASTLAGRYIGQTGGNTDDTYSKSMANAIYGLQLAAAALGLGAQWLSVNSIWEQLLKPLLGIPPMIHIHTIVPVGYPDYEPKPPYRRDIAEITHYEKYDMAKFRDGEQIIEFIKELRNKTKAVYAQEKR